MSQTNSTSLSERSSDSLDTNDEGSWPPKRDHAQRQLSLDEWGRYLDEKVRAIRRCLYWYSETPLESNTELWSKMNSCKKAFVQWGGLAWDIEVALQGEERKAWSEMATNMVDRITQIPEFEMLGMSYLRSTWTGHLSIPCGMNGSRLSRLNHCLESPLGCIPNDPDHHRAYKKRRTIEPSTYPLVYRHPVGHAPLQLPSESHPVISVKSWTHNLENNRSNCSDMIPLYNMRRNDDGSDAPLQRLNKAMKDDPHQKFL